jgi:hypothetical protein
MGDGVVVPAELMPLAYNNWWTVISPVYYPARLADITIPSLMILIPAFDKVPEVMKNITGLYSNT